MLYSRFDDKRHGNFHPYIMHTEEEGGKKFNFRSNIKPNPWRTRAKKFCFHEFFNKFSNFLFSTFS
jgi:hypothetical protein